MAPKKASQANQKKPQVQKKRKEQPLIIKIYLFLYNIYSYTGWAFVLYLLIQALRENQGDYTKVYENVKPALTIVQATASLEVLHSLFGFVPSPVFTTFCQIFSRVFVSTYVLYYINDPKAYESPFLTAMVIAWSVTEVVRYLYYALHIFNVRADLLTWLRYSLFFVLYPIGATCECIETYLSIPTIAKQNVYISYFCYAFIALYIPFFPKLYFYMIKQRKKVLGKNKKKTE